MESYFKTYDIRGKYKEELREEDAYKIGFFIPELLNAQTVLVGRDGRLSSDSLHEALISGITDAGADVYDIGLSTTPMVYYLTDKYEFKASIQITASHNPKEYNGFKISGKGAKPVGYDSGLSKLEHFVTSHMVVPAKIKGKVILFDRKKEYINFIKRKYEGVDDLKIAVDTSNGVVGSIIKDILNDNTVFINTEVDGNFPNHSPNPLNEDNSKKLKEVVVANKCDFGVMFDGDGDRVAFIDEKGNFISPDLITGVLARSCINKFGDIVIYDIRTSWDVENYIKSLGGKTFMWKVGHVYAKEKMREIGAVLGGELAGHYYFKEFMNCDSGLITLMKVMGQIDEAKKEGKKMSDIINEIAVFAYSGEINFKIKNKDNAMDSLITWSDKVGTPSRIFTFDGYRVEYEDWWYNVRKSNTEDYLRIVVEAKTTELMNKRIEQIKQQLEKSERE